MVGMKCRDYIRMEGCVIPGMVRPVVLSAALLGGASAVVMGEPEVIGPDSPGFTSAASNRVYHWVAAGTQFYDQGQTAGVGAPDPEEHYGWLDIWFENGHYALIGSSIPAWYNEARWPGSQVSGGEAYYWELHSGLPQVGKVSGMWAADAFYEYGYMPFTVYPMPGQWGSMSLEEVAADGPGAISVNVYAAVADSLATPSLGSYVESVFDLEDRAMRLEVEYLEGNALESLGGESHDWDSAITWSGQTWAKALWGTASGNAFDFHLANFSKEVPDGPMRLSLKIDGLTTGTVVFNVEAGRRYTWTALVTPEAGSGWNTPSLSNRLPVVGYPERFSKKFYRLVDWKGLYLGSNQAVLHPLRPFDPNLDGIRDVADLIFVGALPEDE